VQDNAAACDFQIDERRLWPDLAEYMYTSRPEVYLAWLTREMVQNMDGRAESRYRPKTQLPPDIEALLDDIDDPDDIGVGRRSVTPPVPRSEASSADEYEGVPDDPMVERKPLFPVPDDAITNVTTFANHTVSKAQEKYYAGFVDYWGAGGTRGLQRPTTYRAPANVRCPTAVYTSRNIDDIVSEQKKLFDYHKKNVAEGNGTAPPGAHKHATGDCDDERATLLQAGKGATAGMRHVN